MIFFDKRASICASSGSAFSSEKNSASVMPNALQICVSVEIFGSVFRVYKLLSVDCVSIASIAKLLTDQPHSFRNWSIFSKIVIVLVLQPNFEDII